MLFRSARENLKGSWAGATGQCQFMPSNINGFARDFDGDGRKDIWTSHGDIFASIAYLLKKQGWQKGKEVGTLAINTKGKKVKANRYYSAQKYHQWGFVQDNGDKIKGIWKRRVEAIPFQNSPVILRGSNYAPLMKWNKSSLFAALNILIYRELKALKNYQ